MGRFAEQNHASITDQLHEPVVVVFRPLQSMGTFAKHIVSHCWHKLLLRRDGRLM
jgi:hypothetical protein